MKGRRTPSARMRKVMSRRITGRRRKGESAGNVRSTQRGRVRFRTDDRNVFWLRYTARAEGRERNQKKKKERKEKGGTTGARVFIGLLCQGYSSADRKPNWYCRHLSSRDLLSKALARPRSYFSSHPLGIFSPIAFYSSLFFRQRRVAPGNMTLFRKRLRAAFCALCVINTARADPPKGIKRIIVPATIARRRV